MHDGIARQWNYGDDLMMNERNAAGLLCAVVVGTLAADPGEEYRQACEAPHFAILAPTMSQHPDDVDPTLADAAWAASEKSCAAFVQRLSAVPEPSSETRFALILAKRWLGGYPDEDELCGEIAEILESLPDNADALLEWAYCIDGDAQISLLRRVSDMGHPEARRQLVSLFEHSGEYFGMPPEILARMANELYEESANNVGNRSLAARAIYMLASDAGNREAAKAIQDRLRRDHGLDSLDYTPAHRARNLDRACAVQMFDLDLEEELCVPALEALAADALSGGTAIPPDVLRHVERALTYSKHGAWVSGPKISAADRLAALLEAHPEPLRSAEHVRVLAVTADVWGDRVDGLRRAVEMDSGNLRARCELADALATTGAVAEAVSLYQGLMAAEHPPCPAREALTRLDNGTQAGTYTPAEDEEIEFIILN